ncbi:MAG: hypothetical protein JXB07_06945 [Anaerolineae bacterium]|nr:hypothetical protein [Anaerolineae bacterium]
MNHNRGILSLDPDQIRRWPVDTKSTTFMIGMILLISLALATATSSIVYRALYNSRLEELKQTSRLEASYLVSQLDEKIAALENFAASSVVQNSLQGQTADVAAAADMFRQQSPGTEAVALISASGEIVTISLSSGEAPEIDRSQWEWLESAKQDVVISNAIADGLTGLEGIHFAIPIRRAGSSELIGVLYTVVDPDHFTRHLSQDSDLELAVLRPNRVLVMGSNRYRIILTTDVIKHIISTRSGAMISTASYGYISLSDLDLGSSPASRLDWIVITQLRGASLLNEIRLTVLFLVLLVVLSAALLCACVVLAHRIFFKSLRALADVGEHLAETNDLDISIPDSISQDLNAISTALKVLIERLKHRATLFETAASISREVVSQDIDMLLGRIAQLIHNQLGYQTVHIYRLSQDGLRADIKALASNSKRAGFEPGKSIVLNDKSYLGRALLRHETQYYEGLESAFAAKLDTPSEIVIPFQEAVPGALHIIGNGPRTLGQSDLDILHLLANEIGAILENHTLFEKAEIAKIVAEEAKKEAEQANQVKSQFLASMSHELRTPLNAIMNFSKFVSSGMLGPVNDEQKDVIDKISASGKHLLDLINDVLDISKIESGSLRLFVEDNINLNTELEGVVAAARALLNNKSVALNTDIDLELPQIIGDRRRIRQIMLNLISNACKFTTSGSITIEMHSNNGEIQFAVRDTGPGIAPDDYKAIFETFRQTEEGLRQGEGTGLGLPIARKLSEAHGGRLWFESQLGHGTTFYMALPTRSEELVTMLERETHHGN